MDNCELIRSLLAERDLSYHVLRDDEETGGAWKIVYKYQGMWEEVNPKTLLADLHWLEEPVVEDA